MNLDLTGVDHQSIKIWIADDRIQQPLPEAAAHPAPETFMRTVPISVIGWQVPPKNPGTPDPDYRAGK